MCGPKEWRKQYADGNEIPSDANPVELGSLFDDWQVYWLGGWYKHRMYYLVVRIAR